MRRVGPCLVAAWALLGCSRDARRLETSGDSQDLVAVAVKAADGSWSGRVGVREDPLSIEFPEGAEVVVFEVPAAALLGADHKPAELPLLKSLELSLDPEGTTGACGRCLSSAGTQTQILLAGQSCRLPHFARASTHTRGDGSKLVPLDKAELVEEARKQFRLHVPGPCQCERADYFNDSQGEVCSGWPEGRTLSFDEVSVAADGSVIAAQPGFTMLFDGVSDTSRTVVHDPPFDTVVTAHILNANFGLMSTQAKTLVGDWGVLHSFINGQHVVARPPNVHEVRRIETDQGAAVLLGEVSQVPFAERCTLTQGDLRCLTEQVELGMCRNLSAGFAGHHSLAGGDRLAIVRHGQLMGLEADEPSPRWRCDPNSDRPELETPGGRAKIELAITLGALGRSVFRCVTTRDPVSYAFVRRAEVPDPLSTITDGLSWSTVAVEPGGRCGAFEDVNGELQFQLGAVVYRATADGTARVVPFAEAYPGLPSLPKRTRQEGGYTVAVLQDGSLYRRAPGSPQFEPLFALDPAMIPSRLALAPGGEVLWLQPPNRLFSARPPAAASCGQVQVEERSVAGLDLSGVRLDQLHRRQDGTWIALGARQDQAVRIDLALDDEPQFLAEQPLSGPALPWRTLRELAPGRLLLLSRSGVLHELRGDEIRVLPVDWDDPETERVEVEPEQSFGPQTLSLRALDAADGVGWASGYGQLFRVTPGLDGALRAEAYWFERSLPVEDLERRTPYFAALRADCADDVVIGSSELFGYDQGLKPRRRARLVLRLGPPVPRCARDGADVLMCPMESWDTSFSGHSEIPDVRFFLPTPGRLIMGLSDGALLPLGRTRLAMPSVAVDHSVGTEDFVAIADEAGRVAFWVRGASSQ